MQVNFPYDTTFRGTKIFKEPSGLSYAYETDFKAIDADGAPNAYHPDDIGLDRLANAGWPNSGWWDQVLVPDPNNPAQPFVQPDGPYQGYFVAMTALRNPNGSTTAPATYVDARSVPFIVKPSGFDRAVHYAAQPGDVGIATHLPSGTSTTFIVGDAGGGGDARLGEASIAFFTFLGGQDPNPRNGRGVPTGRIQYILFPGSRRAVPQLWPRTNQDIHDQAMALVASTPGII
jgi:hypothetical protein